MDLHIDSLIKASLKEDIGSGDVTTQLLLPPSQTIVAQVRSKENGVLCGVEVANRVFYMIDREIVFEAIEKDGAAIKNGTIIAKVTGPGRGILAGERVALNFLQRLSGIATLTQRFVDEIRPYPAKIMDTRKTTPLFRALERHAVRCGGGSNHRSGLFDGILIKDNHIKAIGGVSRAIRKAKEGFRHLLKIEVEVKTLDEVREAIKEGPDCIMLDNFSLDDIKKAVEWIRSAKKDVVVEVSGGVNLKNVRAIASCGVDCISVGTITHSYRSLDITLDVLQTV
jgi:nicotinate-nucleotide pyrophosphorylase (carboxylating)